MTSYKLKPGIDAAYIGGVGRIASGVLLEGNQFSKHAPGLLVEVPNMPVNPPLESTEPPAGPKPLTEPRPEPEEVKDVQVQESEGEEKKPQRPSGRPKAVAKT